MPRDRGHVELEVLPRHEGEGGGRGELNAHRASAVAIGARDGHLGGERAGMTRNAIGLRVVATSAAAGLGILIGEEERRGWARRGEEGWGEAGLGEEGEERWGVCGGGRGEVGEVG